MSKNFLIALLIIVLLGSGAFIWSQNEQLRQDRSTIEQYNKLNQKNTQGVNTQKEQPTNGQDDACQLYLSHGFGNKYVRSFNEKNPAYNTENLNNLLFLGITGFTRKEIDNQYFSIRVPVQESGTGYRFSRNESNEGLRTLDSMIAGDMPTHIDFSLFSGVRTVENIQGVGGAVRSGTCIITDDREGFYHVATVQQCGDKFCNTSMQGYTYITQAVSGDQTLVIRITHDLYNQLVDLVIQESLASLVIK